MSTLDDWIADAAEALGLPAESITHDLRERLLDLTRDVAHGIARVAGPLTTYLVGLAVGGGMPPSTVIDRLSELAAGRTGEETGADHSGDGRSGDGSVGAAGAGDGGAGDAGADDGGAGDAGAGDAGAGDGGAGDAGLGGGTSAGASS